MFYLAQIDYLNIGIFGVKIITDKIFSLCMSKMTTYNREMCRACFDLQNLNLRLVSVKTIMYLINSQYMIITFFKVGINEQYSERDVYLIACKMIWYTIDLLV